VTNGEGEDQRLPRTTQAADWFARMRAPDGENARADFEAWLSDPENHAAYDEIAAIWTITGRSVHASSQEAADRVDRSWLRPALVAAGIAAAFALGFLVVGFAGWGSERESLHASAPGAIRTVVLPDGSRVTLDTASRISVDYRPAERRVTLIAGRARFAVARDPARPFLMFAGNRAVVARGTVFDVRLDRGRIEIMLIEGAVDLEQRDASAAPRRIARLRPGQVAFFDRPDATPRIESASVSTWTSGVVAGEDMRLADIVAQANHRGKARIALAEPELGDIRISGGFRPQETEALAASLAAALDLKVVRTADGALLLARSTQPPAAELHTCAGAACPPS